MNKMKLMVVLGVCAIAGAVLAGPGKGGPAGRPGRGGPAPRQMQGACGPARGVPHAKPMPVHHQVHRTPPPPPHHAGPRHHVGPHHHVAPRHHFGPRHHWLRPVVCPPPRHGGLYGWVWVEAAWSIIVNGVCYYGEGYYYDGCNYYYNGAYYTTPPVVAVNF